MRVFKVVFSIVLLAAVFGAGWMLRGRRSPGASTVASGAAGAGRRILHYVDPMHPAYTSDKPGVAPDCGMTLEPVYADEGVAPNATGTRRILYYRDPRVPSYVATTAGTNPETGNTLEPVYAGAPAAAAAGVVRIPTDRQQLAGVRYASVEASDVGRTLRTVGRVTYDETKLHHVHTRVDGWIEQVYVDFTGQFVKQGQPMLTIYSPEILASQEELLLARRARDVMQKSPLATSAAQGESLFQAARRRLELWNLTEAQIQQVLDTGTPIRAVTLYAPAPGFVLERKAFPHQRVTDESDLYTLADLSTVWVMADLYETDLLAVRAGAPATIVMPNGAGTTIKAMVTYVQPVVDPGTRTLKVRLEAHNAGLRLRPEMFVDVEFPLAGHHRLTVPADAVLNSGERQVVFVDLGDGYLTARTVETGERVGDRLVVTSGLSEGERVVASGTFLIDAESQLKSALGSMAGHQHGGSGRAGKAPTPLTPAAPTPTPAPRPPSSGGHQHD